MNTTALLVDILIIGIQASIWLSGFIFSTQINYKQFTYFMEKSPVSSSIILIAGFYTLGIIIDPIISWIFTLFRTKDEKKIYQPGLMISILHFDKETYNIIDNQYARLRISRATVINLFLITIATFCFYTKNSNLLNLPLCSAFFLIFTIGILLTIISIIAWYKRNSMYRNYIIETIDKMDKVNFRKRRNS